MPTTADRPTPAVLNPGGVEELLDTARVVTLPMRVKFRGSMPAVAAERGLGTPRRRPAGRSAVWEDVPVTPANPVQSRRPGGRPGVATLLAAAALAVAVSACSAPSPTVAVGSGSTASAQAAAPASESGALPSRAPAAASRSAVPSTAPSGSATSDKSATVTAALKTLVAATPQPSRDQIRESLAAAGFGLAQLEITASRTPTGLAADAVEVGVLNGRACVMAQIRSGSVETSVLPVLPSGRCFVGSVQR